MYQLEASIILGLDIKYFRAVCSEFCPLSHIYSCKDDHYTTAFYFCDYTQL